MKNQLCCFGFRSNMVMETRNLNLGDVRHVCFCQIELSFEVLTFSLNIARVRLRFIQCTFSFRRTETSVRRYYYLFCASGKPSSAIHHYAPVYADSPIISHPPLLSLSHPGKCFTFILKEDVEMEWVSTKNTLMHLVFSGFNVWWVINTFLFLFLFASDFKKVKGTLIDDTEPY